MADETEGTVDPEEPADTREPAGTASPGRPEGTQVTVIRPSLSRAGALAKVDPDEPADPADVEVVAVPTYLFDHEVRLERLFFGDRVVTVTTVVDGLSGGGFRDEGFPALEERRLPAGALFETRVDRAEALDHARSIVRHYLNYQFATYILVGKTPRIDLAREAFAYTLYWLVPLGWNADAEPAVTVVDSVTGWAVKKRVARRAVVEDLFVM